MGIDETTSFEQLQKLLSNRHRDGRDADFELANRVVNNDVQSVNYYIGEFADSIVEYIKSSIYNGEDPRTDMYMILSAPINSVGTPEWHKVSLYSADDGCSLYSYTQLVSVRETIKIKRKEKKNGMSELLDYFDYQTLLNLDVQNVDADDEDELKRMKEYRRKRMRRAVNKLKERDRVLLRLLVIEKHSSLEIFDKLVPFINVKNLGGKTKEEVINSLSDKQKQDKIAVLKTRAVAQLVKQYSLVK